MKNERKRQQKQRNITDGLPIEYLEWILLNFSIKYNDLILLLLQCRIKNFLNDDTKGGVDD